MRRICAWCKKEIGENHDCSDLTVTHGICGTCSSKFRSQTQVSLAQFLDSFSEPIVLVNPLGLIINANEKAQALVGKTLTHIDGLPGGNVFECENSYLREGCGNTEHCSGCLIRRTVMACMEDGKGRLNTTAMLNQRTPKGNQVICLTISTERIADLVLLRIDSIKPVGSTK